MSDLPMTPDEARDDLEHLDDFEVGDVYDTARRALATLANMRVEHERHLEDPFTNGGTYKPYRKKRYVTDWQVDQ